MKSTFEWFFGAYLILKDALSDMPVYGYYFCGIIVFSLVSIFTLRKSVKKGSLKLSLPLLALISYIAYEATNPPDWKIRIDIFPIILFLLPTLVIWAKRLRHPINENHGA